ncbi:MAG: hypothetical protein IAE63_04360 [Alphaproteobacteria bacterium]|nr:hypothetical protein [Alphaproteobacteria bacterium]
MDQLEKLLEDFKTDQDIKKFLQSGISLDPENIQSHIQSLPLDKQTEIQSQLSSVMKALSGYIEELGREKDAIQDQIDDNLKSVQACLSYGSAQDISKKKRE